MKYARIESDDGIQGIMAHPQELRNNVTLCRWGVFALFLIVFSGLAANGNAQSSRPRWPFTSFETLAPPPVQNERQVGNEIDRFILQKLDQHQWSLAPRASKQQLLRRVYFDLIGLPPSPQESAAFLQDKSPDAYSKLVDRLLKDTRYGERWARHWLDLARYADTAGYEGDPDLPHAWRYRDYVIDAFNHDKPYDRFIKEQIAGDEFTDVMGAADLPDVPAERIVALTFLRLAPFTEPRGDETRHELLSEMTSTVGSVFLGLTVGCAKCHDHKHDHIPTKDFYRMQAFFGTVSIPRPERGDGFQIGGPIAANFYRPNENAWAARKRAELQKELANAKSEIGVLTSEIRNDLGTLAGFGVQTMGGPLGNDYFFDTRIANDGKLHCHVVSSNGSRWDFFKNGQKAKSTGSLAGANRGQWFGDIPAPKHIALGQYSEGKAQIAAAGAHYQGRFAEILILDHELSDQEHRQLATYVDARYRKGIDTDLNLNGVQFWLDASDVDADPKTPNPAIGSNVESWKDKIAGIEIKQAQASLQPKLDKLERGVAVSFDNDFLVGSLTTGDSKVGANELAKFLKLQKGSLILISTCDHNHEGYGFEVGGNGAYLSTFVNPAAAEKIDLAKVLKDPDEFRVSESQKQRYLKLSTRERFVPQHLKRLRPVAMSLRHSYGPPYEPGVPTSRVMIRGEHDNPGEIVEPGFLSIISGNQEPAKIRLDPFKRWPTRSRRMALANWIASPENPLTARVMVNRIWHWHFGQGIVRTPSDFGELGGGPSHQHLLDWLAQKFIQERWSIKAIHRLILNSNAYKQTSIHQNREAETADPDNRFLWKFSRKRLEAEAIRDSILAISGRLNSEQFGLPIFPPLPNDVAERVKYSNSKWDTQHGPGGRKRSIYIYQQRTLTMPLMQSFDALVCEQSRPRRRTSTTPLQALALMNGDFVNLESKYFAARLQNAETSGLEQKIKLAFQLAFSRNCDPLELKKFSSYVEEFEDKRKGLESLCKILLNSNELIYID